MQSFCRTNLALRLAKRSGASIRPASCLSANTTTTPFFAKQSRCALASVDARRWGSGHGHAVASLPKVSLLDALKARLPGQDQVVEKRLDQLKRNHMQYLSMEINWNAFKPEQQEEHMRELEDLIKTGYHAMSPEQKKAVSLANIESLQPDTDFRAWDNILQKNEEMQLGDWKNMTLAEKKAAYYLAWGPVPQSDNSYKQAIFWRVAIITALTVAGYYTLFAYFRSKKDLPTLSPEHKAAQRERLIKERSAPYTGESAHLYK